MTSGGIFSPIRGPTAIVNHPMFSDHLTPSHVSAQIQTTISVKDDEQASQSRNNSRFEVNDIIRGQVGITAALNKRQKTKQNQNEKQALQTKMFKMIMPETPLKSEEQMYQAGTVKKQSIPNTLIKVVFNECDSGTSSRLELFLTESTKDLYRVDGETQT